MQLHDAMLSHQTDQTKHHDRRLTTKFNRMFDGSFIASVLDIYTLLPGMLRSRDQRGLHTLFLVTVSVSVSQ